MNVRIAIAAALTLSVAARGDPPALFSDLTFNAALETAATQDKFVMVLFETSWCPYCKAMDADVWPQEILAERLCVSFVCIRLNADKEVELARRYKVYEYPTVLFLDSSGNELERTVGRHQSYQLIGTAMNAYGKAATAKVESAINAEPNSAYLRHAYATQLTRTGKTRKAMDAYIWLLDEGVSREPAYRAMYETVLLEDVAAFISPYHPGRTLISDRMKAAETAMTDGDLDPGVARRLATGCVILNDQRRLLAVYDAIRQNGQWNSELKDAMMPALLHPLTARKRYDEVLELVGSPEAFVVEVRRKLGEIDRIKDAQEWRQRAAHGMARYGGCVAESLASRGNVVQALTLSREMAALDQSMATYTQLVAHLNRGGAGDESKLLAAEAAEFNRRQRQEKQDNMRLIPEGATPIEP